MTGAIENRTLRSRLAAAEAELRVQRGGASSTDRGSRLAAGLFAGLFDSAPAGIWATCVADGATLLVNDTLVALSGHSREALKASGPMALDLFTNAATAACWRDVVADGRPVMNHLAVLRTAAGDRRHVLLSCRRVSVVGEDMVIGLVCDVSERERALETLEQSERTFRHVFEAANVGKSITALDGTVFVNHAMAEMLGYERAELDGKSWRELTPPDEIPGIEARLARLISGEKSADRFDTRYVKKDGGTVYADVSVALERDAAGKPVRFITTVVDRTERHRAIEALRASERRFAEMFNAGPAGVVITRVSDSSFADVNDRFLRMSGYRRDEVIGRTTVELGMLTPHGREELLARQLAEGGVSDFELQSRVKSGQPITLLMSSRPIDYDDEPCFITVMIDVTDRAKAADALRASEARYRATFEQAAVGIAHLAPDGRFVRANAMMAQMSGYGRGDLLRLRFHDLSHPDDLRRNIADVARLLSGEVDVVDDRRRFVRKDGSIGWADVKATLLRAVNGAPDAFILVAADVSSQLAAKEERARLEEQYHHAQKMEAIGRLAGGVAHDFNNLLTVILGYSESLLSGLPEGDARRDDLLDIADAAQRAASLSRQLLAFSRKSVVDLRVLDLNAVIRDTEKMLGRLIGEDIEFRTQLDPAIGFVEGDADQLTQVLMNLAVNARDAMPSGGTLRIATTPCVATPPGSTDAPRPWACITVADSGCGMSADTRSRAFEPFFTTKEKGRGTGLGLSVVHGIVAQLGGFIDVDSAPGVGTTFRLCFPVSDRGLAPASVSASATAEVGGSERILLVEDEDAERELAARALIRLGYRVSVASNGAEALEIAAAEECPCALLVTDVVLPGISGPELAQALRKQRPGMRVLFVSGYTDDDVVRYGIKRADTSLLSKPYTPRVLAARIREVLDAPATPR